VTRVGWLDLGCGVSGDMLLGAIVDAGVPLAVLEKSVAAVGVPVTLSAATVDKAGLAATKVTVTATEDSPSHRRWAVIRELLAAADLDAAVRSRALLAFTALAEAEGAVHGIPAEDVHFHEVGAHDAVADIVGVSAGLAALELGLLIATPLALGGGTIAAAHGVLPVPGPAVLQLLQRSGAPAYGGPVDHELTTPTGAAVVTSLATGYGPMPPMRIEAVGVGAGTRDLPDRANVVRLVVGTQEDSA
jgi:uncharacterized protein (TIGR00299 family) protein